MTADPTPKPITRVSTQPPGEPPCLYRELANWYPLLTPVADYAEEAAFYYRLFETHSRHPPRTLLDRGSGGGHNAAQTLHLAELLPRAVITAIDCHAPSIERLRTSVAEHRLAERVRPVVGDISCHGVSSSSSTCPAALRTLSLEPRLPATQIAPGPNRACERGTSGRKHPPESRLPHTRLVACLTAR